MDDYRAIANRLAADISAGRLRPGDRLPPQRRFARDHGIAGSTASRVYGELVRRGLLVGEVGRGSFVRAGAPPVEPALGEPADARVDLELNFPILPGQSAVLAHGLGGLLRPDALDAASRPATVTGTTEARAAAVTLLSRAGWRPDPAAVLFAGGGRQALAATIAALAGPGERLGVETLTYPVVRGIAGRLGVTLVPLATDDDGLLPDAVGEAGSLRAVYVQPTLHNPLGSTMPAGRRHDLADVLAERDLVAIEDTVNGFLRDEKPLAAYAPDRTVLVDSLSKRLAPGLTVGYAVPPAGLVDKVAAAMRSGGWVAAGFALAASTRWIGDGTAAAIERDKRADAIERQRLVTERLGGFDVRADPASYHCWWTLPDPWRAETFVAAAARRGIAVSPAASFTIGAGRAPNAVRLALASPPREVLATALDTLAALARRTPEDAGVD
jgi:DNA-binding transcriptional MocR family regulator